MGKKFSIETTQTTIPETTGRNYYQRRLIVVFLISAILLGMIYAWDSRHAMDPDGISYLDIGDAYLRGDWKMAINAYWSPLYSWLLGLALFFLKPSSYYEFSVIHIVNFTIYVSALGCFHFFLRGLLSLQKNRYSRVAKEGDVLLPAWALLALGYTLFIWSSLVLISIELVNPDLCVSAFVYLTLGILLRIRTGSVRWSTFIILGIILGFSYLTKTFMFPMAFIFLGSSLFLVRNIRKAIPRVLAALITFIAIASPFIIAISQAKGRLTFGDAGRLNYIWCVNGVTRRNWQGVSDLGMPRYALRKISSMPDIYEFGTPIRGTCPLHFDPSYWHEGMKLHFDMKKQICALKKNSIRMFYGFENGFETVVLIFGVLIFYFMGHRRWWLCIKDISEQWVLLVPAIAALVMYSLVLVEFRYVGSFIVLLWMGIFSGMRLRDSQKIKRLMTYVIFSILLLIIFPFNIPIAQKTYSLVRYLIKGEDTSVHIHWQVANTLKQMGIHPGDKVAVLGEPWRAYWARLARLQIVAHIPTEDAIAFWESQRMVIPTLAGTGAKFIIAEMIPQKYTVNAGWQKIGNTDYYICTLKR